jgi:hypothetical protein
VRWLDGDWLRYQRRAPMAGGLLEPRAVLVIEAKRLGKQINRLAARSTIDATFERTDSLRAESRVFGQFRLRQSRCPSESPEQRREGLWLQRPHGYCPSLP